MRVPRGPSNCLQVPVSCLVMHLWVQNNLMQHREPAPVCLPFEPSYCRIGAREQANVRLLMATRCLFAHACFHVTSKHQPEEGKKNWRREPRYVSICIHRICFREISLMLPVLIQAATHLLGIDSASESIAPDFDPAMPCGAERRLQAKFLST